MKTPPLVEQREALLFAWLEVRQYVTPTRFRELVRGNERRVCAHVWREQRRIWERYAQTLATAEGRAEAGAKGRRWAAFEAWALDQREGAALPELAGYDPTQGSTIPMAEFAGRVPPDDPDYPWGSWLDPAVTELDRLIDETDLGEKLRAAGWFRQPAWMSHPDVAAAMHTINRNVACGDSLMHRLEGDQETKTG